MWLMKTVLPRPGTHLPACKILVRLIPLLPQGEESRVNLLLLDAARCHEGMVKFTGLAFLGRGKMVKF